MGFLPKSPTRGIDAGLLPALKLHFRTRRPQNLLSELEVELWKTLGPRKPWRMHKLSRQSPVMSCYSLRQWHPPIPPRPKAPLLPSNQSRRGLHKDAEAEVELSCMACRSGTIIVAGMARDWSRTPGHRPCTPLASRSYKAPYCSRSGSVAS